MYCPECGMYNENSNFFCVKCGFDFDKIEKDNRETEAKTPEPVNEQTYSKAEVYTEKTEEIPEINRNMEVKHHKHPADYFIPAILVAILCNIAFGAAAIIFSGMTQTERSLGNLKKAKAYSGKTKMFCSIGFALGIVKFVFIILISIFVFLKRI